MNVNEPKLFPRGLEKTKFFAIEKAISYEKTEKEAKFHCLVGGIEGSITAVEIDAPNILHFRMFRVGERVEKGSWAIATLKVEVLN